MDAISEEISSSMVFLIIERSIHSGDVDNASSESCNAQVRLFLKPKNNLDEFFIHFTCLLADKRHKETESDYIRKQSPP
ncbi:unnamed protein product [Linum tenue]|uniref:Uncharacterized protein n=1 Tax=Linum tenue TaxID=586396 RepID=A0AAV0J1Z3_9ROSI|nr:unnamed protein product [Linum tenue]